jgi:hypothetical protein
MLFHVERARVEKPANLPLSGNDEGHALTQDIAEDGKEDDRDIDSLWFEVEDLLKDGSKSG